MQPTKRFLEHAAGFAGINGGNPKSPIWFCGIEFATGAENVVLDDPAPRLQGGADFPYYSTAQVALAGGWDQVTKWPYVQKMARISLAYRERSNIKGHEVKEHIRSGLLSAAPDGAACHLNLYPLPMNRSGDDGFGREHQSLTGFPNKVHYKAWCMEHRFPFLRALVEKYSPEVIVCTGSSFRQDFRYAFLGADRIHPAADDMPAVVELTRPSDGERQDGKRRRKPKTVELAPINESTLMVVTPFLGQGGLMANQDLEKLGHILRERASAHRG